MNLPGRNMTCTWLPGVSLCFIAILLTVLFVLYSCKKEDEQQAGPEYWCKITEPKDGSLFQASDSIHFKAQTMGFGDTASVRFSSGNLLNIRMKTPPYEFYWTTPPMLTDTLKIVALATYANFQSSDSIIIYVVDTITPTIKPVPVLSVMPGSGTVDTIFVFDASASYDASTASEDLLYRFDFNGDGAWDTDFSPQHTYPHKYSHPWSYKPVLEVKDNDGLIADTSLTVPVQHGSTPDPCEGYYSVLYLGKVYHTLRLGSQCWLEENLDAGVMIPAGEEQGNNQLIEKYCYEDDTLNCDLYGGLYQWREAMNHIFPISGARGICPPGYHIPSDDDWLALEAFADSQYGPLDDIWDLFGFRGFDAGKRMKALVSWFPGAGATNLSGFTALASGSWEDESGYHHEGLATTYWSASHTAGEGAVTRTLKHDEDRIAKEYKASGSAFSIRCIRD